MLTQTQLREYEVMLKEEVMNAEEPEDVAKAVATVFIDMKGNNKIDELMALILATVVVNLQNATTVPALNKECARAIDVFNAVIELEEGLGC